MKVFFYTLGCKVNHYESQEMGEELERRGFTVVTDPRDADAVVVNSCELANGFATERVVIPPAELERLIALMESNS